MKNILYIGNKLSQGNTTETTIETLSTLLIADGFNVKSVSDKQNKILRLYDMVFSLLRYKNWVDYVLIDTYSTTNFYYAYCCSQLSRYFKLKYIPILHGGNLPYRLTANPILSAHIFKNAFVNVAPSSYLISKFKEHGILNVKYIPNPFQLNDYDFKLRPITTINLLWVRSFAKIYNPDLAIQVLKSLKDDGLKANLCMVGPDKDGSMLRCKALAKMLQLDVEFTGKLSKAEWREKSKDYNVFINTTSVDNTPMSVIEAMALGLPIVSTNVGGIPFILHNGTNGILVSPNNVAAFKEAILQLAQNPQFCQTIIANARKKVESLSWQTTKRLWFSLLS